jgi:class 3 adenylate cyclase/predicted ATPase
MRAQPSPAAAERRHLTVMFCDLVGSTRLSGLLDPEDLRTVMQAYHQMCAAVIHRFDGYIAQYLGDGLLVYFGYPAAHDDDALRAGRAGLGLLHALEPLNARLTLPPGERLAVRLGVHTGLAVVGPVGGGARQELLALGETPNLAARLQELAAPNTLVVSAATWHLLSGFFAGQELGPQLLRGQDQSLAVYQVLSETTARSRLDAARRTGLTPLVGREQEIALLRERWAQVKDGVGQVVLLSGEAGIGKSRLVEVLKEQVATESQAWLTPCQCSPYYQHTALYPVIELLERLSLQFNREETPQQKLSKLEGFVVQYGLPLAEAVPLLATLLSIPLTADYTPLTLSPEQQKHKTLHILLTIMLRIAAQQPLLFVVEDLHWSDPTTLELLTLFVDQGPTTRILTLCTFRPEFGPPWTGRAHCTQITVNRLPQRQAVEVIRQVAHGKMLPLEMVEQIETKTDGVPLFVEELTKMVLESGLLQERDERYALTGPLHPLAIPATLHDVLMARLDRLAAAKALAQLGATLGHEFAYDLLQAVSPWDEETLRRGLHQLVTTEFLYQRGMPPLATYTFKHALIQDVAYQSLLRSTRQQYHQRIAQVLESQFPETVESQPELLAHHYTEANLIEPALRYWQRAGENAIQRSANIEAIAHLTQGLTLLTTLNETPERLQQELDLQVALGLSLRATKGHAAPEVQRAYERARELCGQVGNISQLFPVLRGLIVYAQNRGEFQKAHDLGEQLLSLAEAHPTPEHRMLAHYQMGQVLYHWGQPASASTHHLQALSMYRPQEHHDLAVRYGTDFQVGAHYFLSWELWHLGYADQAMQHIEEARLLAQKLSHPYSLTLSLAFSAYLHQSRREPQATQEQAKAAMTFAAEQGFTLWLAYGKVLQGWALAMQGQSEEGIAEIHQGLAADLALGSRVFQPYFLGLLAKVHEESGQPNEGLGTLDEALVVVCTMEAHFYEAELHRLKGELLLQQSSDNHAEAETCFHQALNVARNQQAKSLELRAATSLARLWQSQGKRRDAYDLLAPVYGWFTEGFDTPDLKEAKALLEELQG